MHVGGLTMHDINWRLLHEELSSNFTFDMYHRGNENIISALSQENAILFRAFTPKSRCQMLADAFYVRYLRHTSHNLNQLFLRAVQSAHGVPPDSWTFELSVGRRSDPTELDLHTVRQHSASRL